MLEYSKDVYYYSNNNTVEFDSNVIIFEYTNTAIIYTFASSISESGLVDNLSFYTKILYDLSLTKEKTEYKEQIKEITKELENFGFEKLDKEKIEELVENKEIFSTRQYTHNVISISELLGKKETADTKEKMTKNEIDDVFVGGTEIPKVDISNVDIDIADIDLGDIDSNETSSANVSKKKERLEPKEQEEKIELPDDYDTYSNSLEKEEIEEIEESMPDVNNNLYDEKLKDMEFDKNETLDIASMLFSKADVKLDIDDKKENDTSKEDSMQVKKLNLNNVSNFIFELPQKPTKGLDVDKIKIPNYILKTIPNFFELQDKGKSVDIDGIMYKKRDIKLEIVDVKENKKYTDREAKIIQKSGQTYLSFMSGALRNINYNENDIVRIIKLATDIYHIEIISSDMQEYKLWSKICNQNFKSSTRKYGMM